MIAFIQGTVLIFSFLLREGKVHFHVLSWTQHFEKQLDYARKWLLVCYFSKTRMQFASADYREKNILFTVLNIVLLTHPYCFMIQVLNTALFIKREVFSSHYF